MANPTLTVDTSPFPGLFSQNLVPNPSFEFNSVGWGINGTVNGATPGRTNARAFSGSYSYGVVPDGTAAGLLTSVSGLGGIPVTPGLTYTFSFYAAGSVGGMGTVQAIIYWYDQDGASVGSVSGAASGPAVAPSFTRFSVTQAAPANARYATLEMRWPTASNGNTWYFDAAQFEVGSSASTFALSNTAQPNGAVRLTWTNANKGALWYSWRVYRRDMYGTVWTLLKEYLVDSANYTFDDYSAKSNVPQQWVVVRTFLSSGVPTEEVKTPTVGATPSSDSFWLLHPFDATQVYKLYVVTSDTFNVEQDLSEMQVINRGRKVEEGTVWGLKGSMACQLRDNFYFTARQQLINMKAVQTTKLWFWLRNPFGDIIRAIISNLQVTRIAGVGVQEYVDITFDYTEIVL